MWGRVNEDENRIPYDKPPEGCLVSRAVYYVISAKFQAAKCFSVMLLYVGRACDRMIFVGLDLLKDGAQL